MELQKYVVVAAFYRYFKLLRPLKLILNNTLDNKKLFQICEVGILKAIVNKIETLSSF